MAATTIKVSGEVRDRLAKLAQERGCSIGALVGELAMATLTEGELQARHAAAVAYIREHLVPDFDEEDIAAGRRMLEELDAGRLRTIG